MNTKQGKVFAYSEREVSIFKATWSFDCVTSVKSRDDLKNLCFHYYKTYG